EMLSRIAPKNVRYVHDEAWHDGNGHSHVKASLVGPSLTIPFIDGNLTLGTWQQIVFIEMDIRPRERTLVIQIIGDNK
ncbi:MAG: secondary thiamine-phosphate synthase enzyme YjbQ, partial [Candidatus Nitrosocosmicus sp.]